ncbi:Uncharacterised protein [Chromobacterium violaceum]|uniref:Uncharacterized protein n=1 Tax=Chromobacterium violaceum TaxID=536 RepID=A0A447TG08_CHRVL|nr:Uncharacterised protein [Chromobacterium violaceum]
MLKSLFVLSLCFLPMLAVADALPLWRQPGYAEAIVKARNGDTGRPCSCCSARWAAATARARWWMII